jgi:hypothetical protein
MSSLKSMALPMQVARPSPRGQRIFFWRPGAARVKDIAIKVMVHIFNGLQNKGEHLLVPPNQNDVLTLSSQI